MPFIGNGREGGRIWLPLFLFLVALFVSTAFLGAVALRSLPGGGRSGTASLSDLWSMPTPQPLAMSEEELADITKPSIVRVLTHFLVTSTVPDFSIDLRTFAVSFPKSGAVNGTSTEQYLAGSGFVVNPSGLVLTNSHVVSEETMRQAILGAAMTSVIFKEMFSLKPNEIQDLEKYYKDKGIDSLDAESMGEEYGKKILSALEANSRFDILREVVVLNPTSTKQKLTELIKDSFPATVLSVNDNYNLDDKDVAILKIGESNLAAMKLGASALAAVGQKIYVFGFPGTAQIGSQDYLEPTFTQGVITAIKDSQNKDFKILQSDAKISEGSSGGPLFGADGEVIGLVTFESGLSDILGDNFASAVPVELAKAALDAQSLKNDTSGFTDSMEQGLALLHAKQCKKATEQFKIAENSDAKFSVNKYADPYIEQCAALIAAGGSLDTPWDVIKERLSGVGLTAWLIAGGGVLVLIIAAFVVVMLRKRMKKEEEEIVKLETEEKELIKHEATREEAEKNNSAASAANPEAARQVSADAATAASPAAEVKSTQAGSQNPELVEYIRAARAAAFVDDVIRGELKKAGWEDLDVEAAFRASPRGTV